jgi:hypothetical protein
MHCCRCDTSDLWMDFCNVCGLTLCPMCTAEGCCGAVPMGSGTFGPTPKWPTTYADFRGLPLNAKPLQALAAIYGPRPLPSLRGGEGWESMCRMYDAGLIESHEEAA